MFAIINNTSIYCKGKDMLTRYWGSSLFWCIISSNSFSVPYTICLITLIIQLWKYLMYSDKCFITNILSISFWKMVLRSLRTWVKFSENQFCVIHFNIFFPLWSNNFMFQIFLNFENEHTCKIMYGKLCVHLMEK